LSPVNAKRGRIYFRSSKDQEKSKSDKNITKHIKKFTFINLYKSIIKDKMRKCKGNKIKLIKKYLTISPNTSKNTKLFCF